MFSANKAMPELLAPAGNSECLKAAIAMGADAVYLSGKSFGARNYADNFDNEELRDWVRYAHLRGVRIYVTVNTLVGDREISVLKEYLKFLEEIGVDALIIQDLSVLSIVDELDLNIRLHASTQLTVHNLKGAMAAKELGFSRVVLSRELSFEEIKYIAENSGGIEIEIFVHGAMCMSYSGQCLMSSALGGRSGNRGRCAQPCRQPYLVQGREKFCLSLKDMSLIEHIDKIMESGVVSLKIEGRMKGEAYVASVVRVYRECLNEQRRPTREEVIGLNRVFYRGGQSSGYFMNRLGTDMFAFSKPDNPYLKNSESFSREILDFVKYKNNNFAISINAKIRFAVGEKIKLTIMYGDLCISVESESAVEPAKSSPIDKARIVKQISKTGNSVFKFDGIDVDIVGDGYASLKELNELRRKALTDLEEIIIDGNRIESKHKSLPSVCNKKSEYSGFTAIVRSIEQFLAIKKFENNDGIRFELIGVPIDILNKEDFVVDSADKERIIIEPQTVMHKKEYEIYECNLKRLKLQGYNKLRVHNISELKRAEEFTLFGSQRLNIANSISLKTAQRCLGIDSVMMSAELSLPQIRDIVKNSDSTVEVCAYGYQPLMITENCIIKNTGKCPCNGKIGYLTDRLDKKFPVIRDGFSCRTILLNSCPTFMGDKILELKAVNIKLINLNFTIETPNEMAKICKAYLCGGDYRPKEFTRLHFNKGIFKETD